MATCVRRNFLAWVGQGMLVAGLGPGLAHAMGLASADVADGAERLKFGPLEPLVSLMQDTPADKLLPLLNQKLKVGTSLKTLVAAGALANARTFGGQDYVGYHAFMALAPALDLANELPTSWQPLPVFKVLHRNSARMQEQGGRSDEVLHEVHDVPTVGPFDGETLQRATRAADLTAAERQFAGIAKGPVGEAFNHLQYSIQDEVDVHRVVLAWRAFAVLGLTGPEHGHTLLRQSVRYCVHDERRRRERGQAVSPVRTILPKLFDEYKLLGRPVGTRPAEDNWIEKLSGVVYGPNRELAAEAVATALAEGFAPAAVAEAISLAATRLVLGDPGRAPHQASPDKPAGSVHGASVGVHAADSANAWRNIALVSNPRNVFASLIVGAYHTAGQSRGQRPDVEPTPERLAPFAKMDAATLVRELDSAVASKDQARACDVVYAYGKAQHAARPVFDVLLRYAVEVDGALHAEKYYRTVVEEFAATRPAFRWRHLAALARVTASEVGFRSPGFELAQSLVHG